MGAVLTAARDVAGDVTLLARLEAELLPNEYRGLPRLPAYRPSRPAQAVTELEWSMRVTAVTHTVGVTRRRTHDDDTATTAHPVTDG